MNLLHEIISSPWFVEQNYADQHLPLVLRMLKGDIALFSEHKSEESQPDIKFRNHKISFWNNGKPYTVDAIDLAFYAEEIEEPSLFILNCNGPISKYDQMCGPDGTKTKSLLLQRADNHPQIFAHLINIDSGGGSGYAARNLGETISKLQKPVFAFIDDFGASAAYWIASAANHIAASSSMTRVGSIGTYMSIVDYTEYFKNEGIRIIDVYAEKSKDKNQDYIKAITGDLSLIQQLANQFNEFFLNQVKTSRHGKLQGSDWNSGKMFFAREAHEIGLIDDIMSFDEYVESIFKEFSPK